MDLDPRYLEAFVVVSRERSFSRASRVLHKTQPAVSYQIKQLEQQLGTVLLDRSTRAVTLTAAGDRLYELCDRFFADFGRLARTLRDPAAGDAEPLRIASVSGFGRYVLFPLLSQRSELRYSLRFPTAHEVIGSLTAGACELGFVYLPLVSRRIASLPVWREELVLIAPRGARRPRLPRELEAFESIPFVTYDESEYVFGKWFEAIYGAQPRSLRGLYHFEELEEVVATVAAARGWSIVPDHCVTGPAARGVVILRRSRRRVRNIIYAVRRAGAPAHAGTTRILDALKAAAAAP